MLRDIGDELRDKFDQDEKDRKEKEKKGFQDRVNLAMNYAQLGASTTMGIMSTLDIFGEASAKTEEERTRATAKRLVVENLLNALTQTALGIASWAAPPIAAAHFAAAAMHYVAMAKAIAMGGAVAGASTGGGSPGGASGAGAYHAPSFSDVARDKEEGSKQSLVIYVYGHQFLSNNIASGEDLVKRINLWDKNQNPGKTWDKF